MRRVKDELLEMDEQQRFYLDGEPFTGIAFEEVALPDGTALSEVTHIDGWQSGVSRDYYSNGRVKAEQWFWEGCPHGWSRSYSTYGSLVEETLFEFGMPISPAMGQALEPTHDALLARSRTRQSNSQDLWMKIV